MSNLTPTNKTNPCPVCEDIKGKCRTSAVDATYSQCMNFTGEVPGWHSIGPTKDQNWWQYRLQEGGRSATGDYLTEMLERRQQREKQQAEQRAASLPAVERDRLYRQLLEQLSLSQEDRAELHRRGLTDDQIKAWGVKSVKQWQRLDWELPHTLPGVNLDGKSLNIPGVGYLCPIRDVDGNLVAFQIRLREVGEGGKYRWVTSATKKRPDGPTPHLPNGELAAAVHRPKQVTRQAIALVEGTGAKPFILAQCLGVVTIGAAGGQFATSPQTLQYTLEKLSAQLGTNRIEFYPDAGAVENHHVQRQYKAAWNLMEGWGYDIQIAWWGQVGKDQPDIDELQDLNCIQFISTGQFWAMVEGASDRLPTSETVSEPVPDVAFLERLAEQEQVEQAQQTETLLKRIEKLFFSKKTTQKPRRSQPVEAMPRATRKTIRFGVDEIPYHHEWKGPAPNFVYEGGDRLAFWAEAFRKGWQDLLDTSLPGLGKSHEAGMLTPEQLELDRLFYMAGNHRNPTTATVEGWDDMPVRNAGMITDDSRSTQSGKAHIRWPKPGENPDITGNCIRSDLFRKLTSKGVDPNVRTETTEDSSVVLNPICAKCRFVAECGTSSGPGFGFRSDRKQALQSTQIRIHPDSLPNPDEIPAGTGAIVDEAGSLLQPTKVTTATPADVAQLILNLKQDHPEIYNAIQPALGRLYQMVSQPSPRFGITHPDIIQALGELPSNMDELLASVEAITPKAADLIQDRDRVQVAGLTPGQVRRAKALKKLIDSFPTIESQYLQLEAKYGFTAAAFKRQQLTTDERKVYRAWERHYSGGKVEDLRAELKDLQALQREINKQKQAAKWAQQVLSKEQSRAELEFINALPVQWLRPFMQIWSGQPGTMRINNGALTITSVNQRQRDIFGRLDFRLYLDATGTPEQLGRALGIDPNAIAICYQSVNQPKNLKVAQIRDVGLCNVNRSESLNNRVGQLKQAIRDRHPGAIIFDWQKSEDRDGYWFNHSRGTNEFENAPAIASFGVPYQNLGALEDQYHALTGQWGGPEFEQLVLQKAQAEIIQSVGRLRARQRPHQELVYYVIGDLELPAELEAVQITSADLCPDAAPAGERTRRAILEAASRLMDNGIKPTQKAVAAAAGRCRSWVSELCSELFGGWKQFLKVVSTLLRENVGNAYISPISVSDISEPDPALAEYELVVATEVLPGEAQSSPPEEIPKLIAEVIQTLGWESWARIAALLPYETRISLLAGMFHLLPGGWLAQKLEAIA